MGIRHVYFCVRECVGRSGRRYEPGDEWDLEADDGFLPGPENGSFWVQREVREEHPEQRLDLPFTPSGRSWVSWGRGPAPEPLPPVLGEYDLLHGEAPIDVQATRDAVQLAFDGVRVWAPKKDPAEHHRRQMAYLSWAAPEQFAACVKDHPEDNPAAHQQPPAPPPVDSAPPPTSPDSGGGQDAAPGELDALLALEAEAEQDSDAKRLTEIRQQIDSVLK